MYVILGRVTSGIVQGLNGNGICPRDVIVYALIGDIGGGGLQNILVGFPGTLKRGFLGMAQAEKGVSWEVMFSMVGS